ncbi:CCA-adding enzyme [Sporomusa carbonis]|uniref:CCA tRNA nucleotidyltransferase n=1 Tax=Sporomusa carbonis TaxID=3076075 RepID=UPI003A766478
METAGEIIAALGAAGHQAYIVGGAVRDLLRGAKPADIDIATGAVPAEIIAIAERQGWKALPVGAAFGVVAVVANGRKYEVATFRTERYGTDSHRPESVQLGVSLADDLARRDFTINAMALGPDGHVVDLFGGQTDLTAKVIRTVGNPRERFAEDGLRMFRAARFAARFGYTVESDTMAAITASLERVNGLSVERVRDEIEKTLLAKFASQGLDIMINTGLLAANCQTRERGLTQPVPILPELVHLDGLPQNPRHHLHDAWRHTMAAVDLAPADIVLRWAALLHDVAKGWPGVRTVNKEGQPSDPGHEKIGAELAAAIMGRLKTERRVADRVVWLIRHHLYFPKVEFKVVLKWLKRLAGNFKNSDEFGAAMHQLITLHKVDRLAGHTQPDIDELTAVWEMTGAIMRDVPFFPAQMAISGREIAAKFGGGPEVGRFQQNLLERIQAGRLTNTREALMAALDARACRISEKNKKNY